MIAPLLRTRSVLLGLLWLVPLFVGPATFFAPQSTCAQAVSGTAGGGAAPAAGRVCDPNVMQTMNRRALLEAQREIEMNGRFIWKPDSVLALTCFQQALNHNGATLAEIFSETTGSPRRDGKDIHERMKTGLETVLGGILDAYMNNNYNHAFSSLGSKTAGVSVLGGSGQLIGTPSTAIGYGVVGGYDASSQPILYSSLLRKSASQPASSADGLCTWMATLWELSHCYSFDLDQDFTKVAFFDSNNPAADQFAVADLRGPSCPTRSGVGHGGAARVTPATAVLDQSLQTATSLSYAEGTGGYGRAYFDDIVSNFKSIADRQTAGGCGPAISTGVTIITSSNPSGFEEKFCPNPGCAISSEGGTCTSN